MKQILAIALLALRHALRSRVLLVLFALLFAAAFLFPLALRSDGTPEGLIRLHLSYTLGIASFLLTLSTLWAGCAAISQEADAKTLQLLLVKPVPRLRLWLGKWLALLFIDAVLLSLVGSASLLLLHHQLRRGGFDPAPLALARQTTLAALQTLRAPLPDMEADVQAEYQRLRARRQIPAGATEAALLASLRQNLLARRFSIPTGSSLAWTFYLPASRGHRPDPAPLLVQFKCDSSVPGAAETRATVTLAIDDAPPVARDLAPMPGIPQTLLFDAIPASATRATVTFSNHGGFRDPTLFFEPSGGLVLRRPAGTFLGNYLRALAALYLRLALFAAIGTTLGTLFSLPVATFLSLVLLLIILLSGFISAAAQVDRETFVANVAPFGAGGHHHGNDSAPLPAPSLAARATANVLFAVYRTTFLALRPLLEDRTLDDLSAGTFIPPRILARALLHQAFLLPFLLALLSTAVLRHREWALPSSS